MRCDGGCDVVVGVDDVVVVVVDDDVDDGVDVCDVGSCVAVCGVDRSMLLVVVVDVDVAVGVVVDVVVVGIGVVDVCGVLLLCCG